MTGVAAHDLVGAWLARRCERALRGGSRLNFLLLPEDIGLIGLGEVSLHLMPCLHDDEAVGYRAVVGGGE